VLTHAARPVTIRRVTVKDVILTLAIMLGAGLVCQLVADWLRLPKMLVLLVAGVLLGPSLSGAIDVPLDSVGAELLLSLGVSFILFHGGLQLSTRVLNRVVIGLTLLALPGVILTAIVVGGTAALVFGLPLTSGLLIGSVLAPTDPAILIPLFERIRLRPKVSQTIIAESALNDPTGAVLALAVALAAQVPQPAVVELGMVLGLDELRGRLGVVDALHARAPRVGLMPALH